VDGVVPAVDIPGGNALDHVLGFLYVDHGEVKGVDLLGVIVCRRLEADNLVRDGRQLVRYGRQGLRDPDIGGELLNLGGEALQCRLKVIRASHGHVAWNS
jgi:hypothetical protein